MGGVSLGRKRAQSSWWKDILVKVKRPGFEEFNFAENVSYKLCNGSTIPFWHAVWYDGEALSKGFPDIYQESTLKAMMVNDMGK